MSVLKGSRPSIPKSRYDNFNNKKLYTVNYQNPYTVMMQANTEMKSTVVSFQEKNLAIQFACALEDYKQRLHQWPTINIDEINYMFFRYIANHDMPYELHIVPWDKHIIGSYCKHNALNLMILSSLDDEQSTIMKLHGMLIQFPFDQEATIERLNNIYDIPNIYME